MDALCGTVMQNLSRGGCFEICVVNIAYNRGGAGGGTRTHTTFYGPRILSPVRLPFRHTGNLMFAVLSVSLNDGSVDVVLLLQHANQFNFKQLDQPR